MTAELKKYMDERFDRLETTTLIGTKTILTAEEAAIYIGYALRGLYMLTSERRIPHFKKNGKLYFKKDELDQWMTENRVLTEDQINSQAATYTTLRRGRRS